MAQYAEVVPSITASHADAYAEQIAHVADFASRLHIDIADGRFTPNKLIDTSQIWWPGGIRADVHVMYRRPIEVIDTLIALQPQLVIVPAEADGDFALFAKRLHYHGIEAGVALLPETPVSAILPALELIDHITIFSGDLGHFGGTIDLSLLSKAHEIRKLSHRVEIGWDGGVNDTNIRQLADAGVEVMVSGGFLQKAPRARDAYDTLKKALGA